MENEINSSFYVKMNAPKCTKNWKKKKKNIHKNDIHNGANYFKFSQYVLNRYY